ncbi:hypothetical protein RJ641_033571, partial [Dillenia turbinata]
MLTSDYLHFSLFPLSNPNLSPLGALSPVGKTESISSDDNSPQMDYLVEDIVFYKNTERLVECSMFASVAGLAYFLSNSLAIEVATALLLPILSGLVKAL